MSDNVLTTGWVAELETPINSPDSDYFDEYNLGINYEGTLVYLIVDTQPLYDMFGVHLYNQISDYPSLLTKKAIEAGHPIKTESIRQFIDIWYNGSYSNHDDLKLVKFKELSNGY